MKKIPAVLLNQISNHLSTPSRLTRPTVLFSNHHLLVVNKPPGWHSVPSSNPRSKKCLLSYLQLQQLGGGSKKTFLLPVHRLDQPVSGVQLYAKTSKAASLLQSQWKSIVKKTYVAIVESPATLQDLLAMIDDKNTLSSNAWIELRGYQTRPAKSSSTRSITEGDTRGSSVYITPVSVAVVVIDDEDSKDQKSSLVRDPVRYRLCSLKMQPLCLSRGLIRIESSDGARHMIRAMLSCWGAPLAGDLRYGATQPLADQSLALHARAIAINENIAAVPDSRRQQNQQQQQLHPQQIRSFPPFLNQLVGSYTAPLPSLWIHEFSILDEDLSLV